MYIINGRVIDPASGVDKYCDVKIENGKISALGSFGNEPHGAEVIDANGGWVVPGLVDLHVHLREPGQSYKETIETGARAAAAGGFTTIFCMPNTIPYVDTSDIVRWIVNRAREVGGGVNILPVGGITKGQRGTELAMLTEMFNAGARAFSEDGKSVADEALMLKALTVAASLNLPVFDHCEDASLPHLSAEAEYIMIERDIKLAALAHARLHICHVSAAESVAAVRLAKAEGLDVTAEVCPHHFSFCEDDMVGGHGRFKMNPPLRAKKDLQALLTGLTDGTLSVIATDHAPHSAEEKSKGMEGSAFGVVGLETAVAAGITFLVNRGVLTPSQLIAAMAVNPARAAGITAGTLAPGADADVTVIDPLARCAVNPQKFYSKGRSTPYEGMQLTGKVRYTVAKGKICFRNGDTDGD